MAIESPHLIDSQSSRRRLCYLFIWPIRSLLSSILRHSYGISFHSELTRAFDSVFDFTVNSIFDLAFDCTTGRVFTPFLTRHRHTLPSLANTELYIYTAIDTMRWDYRTTGETTRACYLARVACSTRYVSSRKGRHKTNGTRQSLVEEDSISYWLWSRRLSGDANIGSD